MSISPESNVTESPDDHRGPKAISRRTALATLGLAGVATALAACGSNDATNASAKSSSSTTASSTTSTTVAPTTTSVPISCVLTQEQEQGPYYYPAAAVRSDVTSGKPGVPLQVRFTVVDVTKCVPVANAAVDIWEADALGAYSDTGSGLFLRGIQMSDANGVANFTSIYPGWYPGRTNHVHIKVHVDGAASTTYTGGHVSHTGNLFFPEDVSVAVAQLSPYTDNAASRTTLTNDFVYNGQNGSGSIFTIVPVDASAPERGYVASMVVGIDPAATPALIGISGTVS